MVVDPNGVFATLNSSCGSGGGLVLGGGGRPGVISAVKLFSSSQTVGQNKLECLSLASFRNRAVVCLSEVLNDAKFKGRLLDLQAKT